MTDEEYAFVVTYVSRLWPHMRVVEGYWQSWRHFVDDLSVAEVVAAVDRLALDGREFAPSGGQVRREATVGVVERDSWPGRHGYEQAMLRATQRLHAVPSFELPAQFQPPQLTQGDP